MRWRALAATLLWASVANAQGVDSRDQEARSLFQAGQTAYGSGRFESALDYFRRSYALSERPELLFNIAQASERLRQDEEALAAYRGYLDALPEAANREFVLARIDYLSRQEAPLSPETAASSAAAPETSTTRSEAPTSAPASSKKGLVAGLAVGGAVLLVVAVVLALTLPSDSVQQPLAGDVGEGGVVRTLRGWP